MFALKNVGLLVNLILNGAFMKKKIVFWAFVASIAIITAGCARSVPIEKVHSFVQAGNSMTQVKKAILLAGLKHHWVMTESNPGVINARLMVRDHSVETRIVYSMTDYSIDYVNSNNMGFDNGAINKGYNRWVRNLDKAIQTNLLQATINQP